MTTIAIYGGSFNPPHAGHGFVAAWVKWSGLADEVWLAPSNSHPFGRDLAPFKHRVRLCDALGATVGPFVHTCVMEENMPAPNYTIQLLTALAERHPEHRFRLVIGADIVADLPRWHRWPDIQAQFDPIIVGRQGYPTPAGAIDFPGVSSTEVRRRIAAAQPIAHLVPTAVRGELGTLYQAESN